MENYLILRICFNFLELTNSSVSFYTVIALPYREKIKGSDIERHPWVFLSFVNKFNAFFGSLCAIFVHWLARKNQ